MSDLDTHRGRTDVIYVTENVERNERIYRHVGCTKWMAPHDGITTPESTVECNECAEVLPTVNLANQVNL